MRQKFISLTLALMMIFAMGVPAAAADDQTDETDKYVEFLAGKNLMQGYPDGGMGLDNILTRAEAAALVYRLANGEAPATAEEDTFEDLDNDHWALGYIGWCVDSKIVVGYGDGKFGPSDRLTVGQYELMLGRLLGYADNAIPEAVTDGVELEGTASVSRSTAARMTYNALFAEKAEVGCLGMDRFGINGENGTTGYVLSKDIGFVPNAQELQKLDVYVPEGTAPAGGWPVVVYVHGGGFVRGDKAELGPSYTAAIAALNYGFALVSVNYRLVAEGNNVTNIDQAVDVKAAIRYVRANADQWELDASRIALQGPSAGGGLVAVAGLSGNSTAFDKALTDIGAAAATDTVSAVIAYAGNYSRGEGYEETDALKYIDKDDPSFFVRHGDADENVNVKQSVTLNEELTKAGVAIDFKIVPGAQHTLSGQNFYELYDANDAYEWLKVLFTPAEDEDAADTEQP